MEPLTLATTFSTLVGLLRIFKQERGDRAKANHQQFIEWVDYHRHEQLKELIVNSAALRDEVDKILAADQAKMMEKLDAIEEMVARLLSRVEEFRGLSQAIAPNSQLSEQAIFVLRQFVESGGETLYYKSYGRQGFTLNTENGEPMSALEPRLLGDDLRQLAEIGLITSEYASEGLAFGITRNAIEYVNALPPMDSNAGRVE